MSCVRNRTRPGQPHSPSS